MDLAGALFRVKSLEAKIRLLTKQLEQLKEDAANLDEAETTITQLERTRELQEAYFKSFSLSAEQARIEEAFGQGKVTNIPVVQEPSPPALSPCRNIKEADDDHFGVRIRERVGAGVPD